MQRRELLKWMCTAIGAVLITPIAKALPRRYGLMKVGPISVPEKGAWDFLSLSDDAESLRSRGWKWAEDGDGLMFNGGRCCWPIYGASGGLTNQFCVYYYRGNGRVEGFTKTLREAKALAFERTWMEASHV